MTDVIFQIYGPLEVPFDRVRAGRVISTECVRQFWEAQTEYAQHRGCYVFGIRNGGGATPTYVGKATKSFRQEVFAPHKLNYYQQCLAGYLRGTPVLFFVSTERRPSRALSVHVGELESYLIQTAVLKNPDLFNVRGTSVTRWSIAGVLRYNVGRPSRSARDFQRALGINSGWA
jgi:hypothetical protein